MQKWIILLVVFIIVVLSIFIVSNVSVETEYTPETEIEDVELRKTIVTLYFKNKETGELAKETRLIDSKELLKDPYGKILNLLVQGPENSNYERIIPEGVTIADTKYENGCVTVKLRKENVEIDETTKNDIINSFNNTLTQLTEVTSVKLLIEGEEENSESENKTNEVNNETKQVANETNTNQIENNLSEAITE